jgi:hypothetical protein
MVNTSWNNVVFYEYGQTAVGARWRYKVHKRGGIEKKKKAVITIGSGEVETVLDSLESALRVPFWDTHQRK